MKEIHGSFPLPPTTAVAGSRLWRQLTTKTNQQPTILQHLETAIRTPLVLLSPAVLSTETDLCLSPSSPATSSSLSFLLRRIDLRSDDCSGNNNQRSRWNSAVAVDPKQRSQWTPLYSCYMRIKTCSLPSITLTQPMTLILLVSAIQKQNIIQSTNK